MASLEWRRRQWTYWIGLVRIIVQRWDGHQVVVACSFSLVGKLLTSKRSNVMKMKESLRRAWGSPDNLTIVEACDNLFHFRFANESNFHRVLNGGPWNFDNHILALQPWEPEIIGKRIGSFYVVDDREVMGRRGRFLRVRAGVPIDKPLKHGGYITLGNGAKYWVDYKFERLNNLCYYYGSLLLEQEECGVKPSDEKNGVLKEGRFGQWMKANSGGRQQTVSGSTEKQIEIIEIKDSDWISHNGKEIRMGELIPNSLGSHFGMSEARGGPLDLVKNFGLGKKAEIQVEQILTEVNPFGLELLVLSVGIGTGLNVEGLEISSTVSSSSTRQGKNRKGYQKASVQADTHKLVSGKEASLVLGKKKTSNGAGNAEGAKMMGDGMYDGEKRRVLCEFNASGGECILAKEGVKLDFLEVARCIINVCITDLGCRSSRVVRVYASTDQVERRKLWRHLALIVGSSQEPCVIGGDFNCILSNEEKDGGLHKENWELRDFQRFCG
ncbi:hypothetical protein RHSIM_Rhsim04G0139700 [Rhododendron simsii]|uniref:DUF4283 domain-containing protein n=1 Tax=Rhododendron simsii TaxID=118357 RepID=A0A834H294_RHOSS|nr:hypothetical protein RHSIM_Rhsim04G0139700 [Rhododendron simsii]